MAVIDEKIISLTPLKTKTHWYEKKLISQALPDSDSNTVDFFL